MSSKRAVAWDPRNPATLLLPSVSANKEFEMNTFLSHDGIGCNEQERAALMDLLDAQDSYLESNVGNPHDLLSLSKAYQRALAECVQRWEEELNSTAAAPGQGDSAMEEDTLPAVQESLELLKISYAITQLSETFLLLPASDHVMDYYETTSNLPGAVTAETVRYLRFHHLPAVSDFIDPETYQDLMASYQPEEFDGTGELYWKLMERHVVRGNLEDAWALMTRHSLCRQCTEADYDSLDDYTAATLDENRAGLEALRAILLSAPLPGGRSDAFDASFGDDSMQDDDPNSYIEGIPPSAYRLWETTSSRRRRRLGSVAGDIPTTYNSHVAKQVYNGWKQSIRSIPALNKLKRRMPQVAKILAIMEGDLSKVEFDSWAEEFCAELIYQIPELQLVDMHIRASRVMKLYSSEEEEDVSSSSQVEEVILSVMKGNGGRVIEALHQLGGGSGAALPAVMTSLLCNLLDEAQILPQASDKYDLKTELLLDAAFAIHSSLGMEGHDDLGTRLTVRFLLPYIKVDSDVRITATLVNTIEHHSPKTDAEANALLALCRSLVERKNVRILDACVSICLARYRYYLQDQRPGGAVHWLMVGMEFESLVLGNPKKNGSKKDGTTAKDVPESNWQRPLESGICHRLLVTYCLETSQGLLKGLLGEEEGVSLLYARAKEMIATAIEESEFSSFLRPARALEHILIIAEAIAEKKEESIVARSIVACLEGHPNEEDDGAVSSLARPSMHWNLLRLAKGILERNAQSSEERQDYTAFFDVRGMRVLLECFTVIAATREMEGNPLPSSEVQEMRLALGEGLMRAFVAENGRKKAHNETTNTSVAGICSSDLRRYSREKQEQVVAKMLDY
eukprot:scaffold22620_cov131-Cylindrotheca_fusiformis.AAC.9